jgi:hypothetical protein
MRFTSRENSPPYPTTVTASAVTMSAPTTSGKLKRDMSVASSASPGVLNAVTTGARKRHDSASPDKPMARQTLTIQLVVSAALSPARSAAANSSASVPVNPTNIARNPANTALNDRSRRNSRKVGAAGGVAGGVARILTSCHARSALGIVSGLRT